MNNAIIFLVSMLVSFSISTMAWSHITRPDSVWINLDIPPLAPVSLAPLESYDESDVFWLAKNIFFEARGEDYWGQVAIGWVTVQRVWHVNYPATIEQVVVQSKVTPRGRVCQFSWYCGYRSNLDSFLSNGIEAQAWQNALQIAEGILHGDIDNPVLGSVHYHADYVNPRWARRMDISYVYGSHVFLTTL